MEELNQYLEWCDVQYSNSNHCFCGAVCTNNNYCRGNQTDCYSCIKRVHNYKNKTVHYNCAKMLYNYVLKHSYRFGAEIFYEIHKLTKDLYNWDDIFILSIGCGPCTELFGAMSLWRTMGKQDESFHYRGFDTEEIWLPLMKKAESVFTKADVLTFNIDAFLHYKTCQERVDVIVLNYMLSDMLKFHSNRYDQFLSNLSELIKQIHPRYLLLNDVYLLVSVDASNRLLRVLKGAGLDFKHIKLQYHRVHNIIGQFGKLIDKQPYVMPNAEIVRKYIPFSEVNSIQTLIKFL